MQHECQICGKPASRTCPGCNAMFYCSEKHLRRRALGHADECARMAEQLGRRQVRHFDGSQTHLEAATRCSMFHRGRGQFVWRVYRSYIGCHSPMLRSLQLALTLAQRPCALSFSATGCTTVAFGNENAHAAWSILGAVWHRMRHQLL